jgi:hypothetical protein
MAGRKNGRIHPKAGRKRRLTLGGGFTTNTNSRNPEIDDMRKIIAALQTSVDGFIEGPNGELDWAMAEDEETWSISLKCSSRWIRVFWAA